MGQLIDISATLVERTRRLRERARDRMLAAVAARLDVDKVEAVDAKRLGTGDHRVVDAATFRGVMSSFPTGVGVVTALDEQGLPRGLTCSAIASVSLDPPLLLVCVDLTCGSLRAIRHSKGFVVNVLSEGAAEVSQTFASSCDDKFDSVAWSPSRCSGLPVLSSDAVAYADCRLQREIVAGDHAILIGLLRDGMVPDHERQPLLYWRRAYAAWPAARVRSAS
jgi:flavin reductase (DIM6/NTAB) family NADH-FMN oxidoreductase RutF